jgi:hypothetical protein
MFCMNSTCMTKLLSVLYQRFPMFHAWDIFSILVPIRSSAVHAQIEVSPIHHPARTHLWSWRRLRSLGQKHWPRDPSARTWKVQTYVTRWCQRMVSCSPVVGTLRVRDSGVDIITDDPGEPWILPQADILPVARSNVCAARIEITSYDPTSWVLIK